MERLSKKLRRFSFSQPALQKKRKPQQNCSDQHYEQFRNKKVRDFIMNLSENVACQLIKKMKEQENLQMVEESGNYTELKKIGDNIQPLGYDSNFCMIYGINGYSIDKEDTSKLLFVLRRHIDQCFYNPRKQDKMPASAGISLIFFSDNRSLVGKMINPENQAKYAADPMKIEDFKNSVLKKLNYKHLIKINKIVILFSDFATRSWNYLPSLGTQNGLFDNFFQFIQSLEALQTQLGPLFNLDQIDAEILNLDKSQSWRNVYNEADRSSAISSLRFFQQLKEKQEQKTRSSAQEEDSSQPDQEDFDLFLLKSKMIYNPEKKLFRIPIVLDVIARIIKEKYLKDQGLFRCWKIQARIKKLIKEIQRIQKQDRLQKLQVFEKKVYLLLQNQDPRHLTYIFQKILFPMKQSIVPDKVYQKLKSIKPNEYLQQQQMKAYKAPKHPIKDVVYPPRFNLQLSLIKELPQEEDMQKSLPITAPIQSSCESQSSQKETHNKNEEFSRLSVKERKQYYEGLINKNEALEKLRRQNSKKDKSDSVIISVRTLNVSEISQLTGIDAQMLKKKVPSLNLYLKQSMQMFKSTSENNFQLFAWFLRFIKGSVVANKNLNSIRQKSLAFNFMPRIFIDVLIQPVSMQELGRITNLFVRYVEKIVENPEQYL